MVISPAPDISIDSLNQTTSPSVSRACIAPLSTRNQSEVALSSLADTSTDQRSTPSRSTIAPAGSEPVAPLPCSSFASKSSCHTVSAEALIETTPNDNAPANNALTTLADLLSLYFCVLPS